MSDSRVNIGRAMLVGAVLLAVSALLALTSMSAAQVETPSPGPTKGVQNPAQQQTIGPSTKTGSDSGKGTPTSGWMPSWVTANGVVALFTVVLAVVGFLQWWIYRAIHRSTKVVERAYVNISHYPEGLQLVDPQRFSVKVKVKNHGRTPAKIIDVVLTLRVYRGPLPPKPCYGPAGPEPNRFFLMPKDHFVVTKTFELISAADARGVDAGTVRVWLLGYVDYEDQFGRSHRGGYARLYNPARAPNNLIFEGQQGYNYDTP